MKRIKTAVVGCGSISDIYMTNLTNGKFTVMELVACSDLMVERMNASAAKFGIKAMSLDEICADPEIEMVICLTTPAAHYPIIKQALLAGKHVFSEKMIAVDLWQGKELVQIANEKGLHLGVAAALPWFTPFLAGATGTLIALVWYFDIKARERAKKRRGKAFTAMMVDICVCILAVCELIVNMLSRLA